MWITQSINLMVICMKNNAMSRQIVQAYNFFFFSFWGHYINAPYEEDNYVGRVREEEYNLNDNLEVKFYEDLENRLMCK